MQHVTSGSCVPFKLLVCLVGAALAFGVMGSGAAVAYADADSSALKALSLELSPQSTEQNYAVFDSSTNTLTFYYGQKPEPGATQTIYEGYDAATTPYAGDGDRPWYPKKSSIKHVVFDSSVSEGNLKPKNTAWWFGQFNYLEDVAGLSYLDMSDVTSMAHMFDSCSKITALDLSVLDTSHVTNMAGLLNGCSKLASLTIGGSFTTVNVTAMGNMFAGCSSLASIDTSSINTASAKTMYGMFDGCSKLASLDLTGFDTSNVENMGRMFAGCAALTNLQLDDSFNTSKVTDMIEMFSADSSIETLTFPTSFDTSNVTNMRSMFHACKKLGTVNLTQFNTAKVTTFHQMFDQCESLTALDLSTFSTAKAESLYYMFQNCTKLESIVFGDAFTVANADTLFHTFEGCKKLKNLDLSRWRTSKVTAMQYLFHDCVSLETIDLSNWDFSKAYNLNYMFSGCTSLKSVNLGNYHGNGNSSDTYAMSYMFSGCSALETLDLSGWNTSQVTYMNGMFNGCTKLNNPNLTSFNTSNVTDFREMFRGCTGLETLDLSSFNTLNGTFMSSMFANCSALKSITFGNEFKGTGKDPYSASGYATLPTPSVTDTYNGLWWKGAGTTSYTPAQLQDKTGSDIAGTWTWSEGIAVALTASPVAGGTVAAVNTGVAGGTTTLVAKPASGYEFSGWALTSGENTGALSSTTTNPTTFTFGSVNGAVTATFVEREYAYTIGALSEMSFTYNGSRQVPAVAVTDDTTGAVLAAGTDYTVSYEKGGSAVASPTDMGTYTVYVTGAGDYATMAKQSAGTFAITRAAITSVAAAGQTFTGAALKPIPTVKAGDLVVPAGAYDASYSNNVNAGTATVTVTGKGNYTGTKSATFAISPAKVTPTITLAASSYTWDGKAKKPTVTVKVGSKALVNGTDYTVTYATGCKNVGAYKVTVACKGNYSFADKKLSFTINPKGTTVKAPKAGAKALTVKWAKQAKKMSASTVTGYQVQVATNKAFTKNKKQVNVKGFKKTSVKVTKLKAKKAYYARVRTYMKVGKATYCSAWSTYKKAVKTQ